MCALHVGWPQDVAALFLLSPSKCKVQLPVRLGLPVDS